ncbi:MAG: acyl-CoA dehydrogenase family protein [Planctomycetaceae bacterium]|jgi:alkylation response protein AidB-like acyl-CoA dehydrogenase|nr:acyl-CoA dehydrogenase family protein [Planctomycetaceae bacterium]
MFELSEELTMVRDAAREFAERELKPRATKHDRQEHLDAEVLKLIGELGFWGLTVSEEYGGSGLGNLALSIVLEELNRGCGATGVTVSVHNSLLCSPLMKYGNAEQKKRFLPKLASGEWIGAYCLTEPGSGSDAAALSTRAVKDGDHYVLDGTKIWVTSGSMAGLALVYARTNPDVPKAKGISAFLVETSTPGCIVGKKELKCGIRGSPAVELQFDKCRVPAANMVGALDKGFPIAMDTLDGGRIGIAAQSVGIGQACLEEAISYAKVRVQFGKPIAHFQAIQHKIADMQTRLSASRMLVQKAAWLRDRGEPCGRQAAEAKLFASQTANFCADECLQIHGGAGYTDHFIAERLFRDARITEIYEGATDIQRLVIARSVIG